MNTLIQENRCHECKKLFCCASCRDLHVKKKHPKSKTDTECLLCLSKELPLEKSKDSGFLCHLVIRHLPLICVLCGQLYRSSSDLENFVKCDYWRKKTRNSLLPDSVKKLPVQATPSPIIKTLSCPAITSCHKESPDSEFHTLQSFTSPPELMRNTSTPMHVGVLGQRVQPQFKTPKLPAFCLKTPKTPKAAFPANNKSATVNLTSNNETAEENPSPSLFYSATSQLLTSKEVNSDNTPFGSVNSGSRSFMSGDTPSRSTAATPNRFSEEGFGYSREFFRTNSARILEVMEEQEEHVSVSMDLTDAQDHLYAAIPADDPDPPSASILEPVKDLPKKVRFSDQHQFMAAESTIDPVSDSEEFYEAPELPGEKSINQQKSEAQMVRENEDNSDKENLGSPEDSKVFKTPASTPAPTATSSRVVMMVVVENGFDISTSSLVPLINSSLQKLERNPLTENIPSISSVSEHMQTAPNSIVRSVSSVDTFTASSTVDYYSSELSPSSMAPQTQAASPSASGSGHGGGGIFSAMAQAVRYALRGLPGTGQSKGSPESLSSGSSDSPSNGTRTSPSSFTTITESLLRRPGKRSRDPVNDAVIAHRRDLRSPRHESGTSPVAKRPRSWHKIRGRDPIARMRRDTPPAISPRGVSSETQHFQQGSLSVGDTILPLPSRAHQSTQTD